MECASSPDFFLLNENIGKVPESTTSSQKIANVAAASVPAVATVQNQVVPVKAVEPVVIAVPLPAVQPVIQAQAVASSSTADVSVAIAPAVQVSLQAEPAIDVPVQVALDPVPAVVVPEPAAAVVLPAPVEIPAPVVLSIADAPIQLTVNQEVRFVMENNILHLV